MTKQLLTVQSKNWLLFFTGWLILSQLSLNAQNVSFTTPDTVCVNTPVTITNTSSGASSYYWNFCVANLNTAPTGQNLGNIGSNFSQPVFMDYAFYNNNYYAFVINHSPGGLTRLDFGNSLLNTPTSVSLGNFGGIIPPGPGTEGIQIVFNEGKWYAIIVGGYQPSGSTPRILKLDFGSNLTNTSPIATNWGNLGNMSQPIDLHVFKEGNNWYGLTISAENNTITRFNFTNSFDNSPTGVNLGNIGNLNYPTGIYAINDNGFWRVFITNGGTVAGTGSNASLTRLDFGGSLLNTPVGLNLGNPGNTLQFPRDLTIMKQCGQIVGFAVNGYSGSNGVVKLDFQNNLAVVPSLTFLGTIGNTNFAHSISKLFRVNEDVYGFITNVSNNTLTRLKFSGCTNASTPSSTLQNPPSVSYNQAGTYNINLTIDDGLPTQAALCKQVVIVENTHAPLQAKSFCSGDSVLLTSAKPSGNTWNTGSTANSIYVKSPGTYWVQTTKWGCANIDSFVVTMKPLPQPNLGADTTVCSLDSLTLDAGNAGATYLWQNGQTTQKLVARQNGIYHVTVTMSGCAAKDSIVINSIPSPVVRLSNDTAICTNGTATLTVTGGGTYNWTPSAGLSSTTAALVTAQPNSTTKYFVTVTANNGCRVKDSVIVTVIPGVPCALNVSVSFTVPDTVCVNTPVNITNTSSSASSYYWNFCVANLNTPPTGQNLGNIGGRFSTPVFMDYAFYNNNYYGFVVNHSPGNLIRLDFGNSLLNTPTSVSLGNFGGIIPSTPAAEGVQIVFNEGKWYAIIVGGYLPSGSTPRILKIDFGSNLANPSPIATNWGNLGNMSQPIDLHVFKEGSNWYGLTISAENNTITRFNFTNSFDNTPTAVNLGNVGNLNYPTGIYAINDNGYWRVFITNGGTITGTGSNASLTRLDFGASLLNTPIGINLGNPGNVLQSPRDLTIMKQCGQIVGFAVNGYSGSNGVVKIDFQNNLATSPSLTFLGTIGNTSFAHSISKLFRVNEDIYGFITNASNNTLTRLKFTGCTNASLPNSTLQNPPPVTYNAVGTYNINLTIDDGLATQAALCKPVVVVQDAHTPLQTKTFCAGDSVLLTSAKPSGNTWNTGSNTNSIYVKNPGTYWVQTSRWGCVNIDSFMVTMKPSPIVNLGADTALCVLDSVVLDAGNTGGAYTWQNGQATQKFIAKQNGTYHVAVTANGCVGKDSIVISSLPLPSITLSNDTTICKSGTATLTAGGGNTYAWSPATGLSGSSNAVITANPDTTTKYYVLVTNQYNCKARDSVIVTVAPNRVVNIGVDTSLCTLDSMTLNAGNTGASFLWQNNQTTQTFVVNNSGIYHVTVNVNGCLATDSIIITDLPSPSLILSADTTICKPGAAALSASGGDAYSWSPATGLSNTTNSIVTASPATTTTYHLTATNNNGCVAKDSVKVSAFPTPVVDLGIDTALCTADSLVLNTGNSGATYSWQNGQASQTFIVKGAGLYYVTVSKNGCSATDSILINPLQSPVVLLSSDTTICKTGMANLTASGGTQYTWLPTTGLSNSTSATTTASPDTTTKYYITVKNADNCISKDSVEITVIPKPVFTIASSKPILCLGDTAVLSAAGGDSYTWQPSFTLTAPFGSTTEAFPATSSLYSVAIDHANCKLRDTLFINLPVADKPVAALTKSNDINCFQGQATLIASGGTNYIWRPSFGLSDSISKNPVASINQSTTYHVIITTRDGCQVEDSITVYVEKGDDGTGFGVPTAFTPNADGKNDCFGVPHWGAVTEFSLNLYNRWGERIFHADNPSQCWNGIYKGVLQPTDVYVYWIKAKTRCGDVFRKGTFALIK